MYQIIAAVKLYDGADGSWKTTVNLPTFFLSAATQGIVDKGHARKIAKAMLRSVNPMLRQEDIVVHVDHFTED
jgi:hypothetical protein